jgi:bifunctional UDP-N-acetylglucosamine pyrophosphorylase/glucosamine-1-phosphate N-acetyltransferase
MRRVLVIPAAGRGSRLGSDLPKLLVPVNGRAMIEHLLERYRGFVTRVIVVVSPSGLAQARAFARQGNHDLELLVQESPTGMLDAILVPRDRVAELAPEEVWITWCDQIAVGGETVARLARAMAATPPPALAFATVRGPEPYIHFDRSPDGLIRAVRQRREGDAMPVQGEGDAGVFALSAAAYLEDLPRFAGLAGGGAGTGERNFLPFIPWLAARQTVSTVAVRDPIEAVGINTPAELARVAAWLDGSSDA